MEMSMEMKKVILFAGVEAVSLYTKISNLPQDNEVPERFITYLMAVELHKRLGLWTKVEHPYTLISDDLGLQISAESRRRIAQLTTDIALYKGDLPIAALELKKLDERTGVDSIHYDLHKGDPINLSNRIGVYAGVMVCETAVMNLKEQKTRLGAATGCSWEYSNPVRSRDGNWYWCFGMGNAAAS